LSSFISQPLCIFYTIVGVCSSKNPKIIALNALPKNLENLQPSDKVPPSVSITRWKGDYNWRKDIS